MPESRSEAVARGGYDVWGAVTITFGTIALVFTLIKANDWGWSSGRTLAGFAIAAVVLAAALAIERRHEDPLIPLRIFRNRSLSASDGAILLLAASIFGMFFFLTLYMQQVLGYTALETGIAYLPLSLTIVAGSALASRFVDRFGPKPVAMGGLLVAAAGFLLLRRVSGDDDYASHVLPTMFVLGVGLGMSFVPLTISATNGVAPGDAGLASGLLNTTQQVGFSLGLAVLSSVSTSRLNDALDSGTPMQAALTHAFKGAFGVAAGLCIAAVVVALLFLPPRKRRVEDRHVEAAVMSFARCPGAPYCGHLAQLVAFGRRVRHAVGRV